MQFALSTCLSIKMITNSSRNWMMNSLLSIFTITCYLLVNQQWASASTLPKPVLKLHTGDPRNIIMIGDTITLKCTNGSGDRFYLVHEKPNGKAETTNQSSAEFRFTNIQIDQDGDYFCKYSYHGAYSELSSPLNIFVQDTYLRPIINVSPRRVVMPGTTVIITCSTHFKNVVFFLFKNEVIIRNGSKDENNFSYVINHAKEDDMGYYSCMYKSSTSGMSSVRSNAMKISILAFLAPSVTWEEDPNNSTMLRINCTVPENHEQNQFFFTLLGDSKIIEDEVTAIKNMVIFSITKPKFTVKRYQCMYRVKLDYDYADSLHSIVQIASEGYYILIFIRHILSALILILMGIILLLHFKDFRNTDDLPRTRVTYAKRTEVVWTSDDEQGPETPARNYI